MTMTSAAFDPTPAYLQRPELWEDRTVTVRQARKLIDTLDPVKDCAAITHLSIEVIVPPMMANVTYLAGGFRAMTHKAEAVAGYRNGTGVQITDPEARDRDTLTFFGLLYKYGPDSAEVKHVVDRIQQIHHDVKGVSIELQRHVQALMIIEQHRWVRDLGQGDFFSKKENDARFHLWVRVGKLMGIENIWDSYEDVEPWVIDWENRHREPSKEAAYVLDGGLRGFSRWAPWPFKPVAKQILLAGTQKEMRDMTETPRVWPGVRASLMALLAAERATEAIRPVNLSSTWIKDFSRFGEEPDLHAMGYQHDVESDDRYLRKGDPADGYRFTVERGVESLRAE